MRTPTFVIAGEESRESVASLVSLERAVRDAPVSFHRVPNANDVTVVPYAAIVVARRLLVDPSAIASNTFEDDLQVAARPLERYSPRAGSARPAAPISIENVRLVEPPDLFSRNMSPETFANHARAIEAVARRALAGSPASFRVQVRVVLRPSNGWDFALGFEGAAPRELLQGFWDGLRALNAPPTRTDPLHVYMTIHVLAGAPTPPLTVP